MDKQKFTDYCEQLSNAIGCEHPNHLTLNEYYDQFKHLSESRFKEIINHLKEHTEYKRFPLIWNFKESLRLTHRENNYTPLTRENDRSDANEDWQRIVKGLKIMDIIRKQVCEPIIGSDYEDRKSETYPIMRKFYREKVKQGLVYDVGNEKWIPKSQMQKIGGYYFNPADF